MSTDLDKPYHSRLTINIFNNSGSFDEVQNTINSFKEIQFENDHPCYIPTRPLREFFSEFIGTLIFITIGIGTVAQVTLSGILKSPAGTFISTNWGFGFAIMIGMMVSGKISGGHMNPAVTIAFAIFGKLKPWHKCFHYMFAQYLGAFFGSALVYITYYEAFQEAGINIDTAKIFATYPAPHISAPGIVLDEFVGTALLLMSVCAIIDKKNLNIPAFFHPFLIGLVVFVITMSFSFNAGAALNPARDLGPRLFTAVFGWGLDPFSYAKHFWMTPILATHAGAIIGVLIYQTFIGWQLSLEDQRTPNLIMNL
ncbi:aquaporin-3 isoform X1 [Lepeophtheirus salmonis]|uniref:aquaporin-3 isoform X1 n=1 Tax=Lepeophtheirus salmonis TaxID=72036 RepID=UPI001AE6FC8E|nr:aquaporin-3-like isoform X1 [Lepeophtheirus salmonis]